MGAVIIGILQRARVFMMDRVWNRFPGVERVITGIIMIVFVSLIQVVLFVRSLLVVVEQDLNGTVMLALVFMYQAVQNLVVVVELITFGIALLAVVNIPGLLAVNQREVALVTTIGIKQPAHVCMTDLVVVLPDLVRMAIMTMKHVRVFMTVQSPPMVVETDTFGMLINVTVLQSQVLIVMNQ